jgi:hypothetical protein
LEYLGDGKIRLKGVLKIRCRGMDWFIVNCDTVQLFDCVNAVINLRVLKYWGMHRLSMLSIVVQPFVGPWPLFSFLILYTVGMIS